MNENELDFHTRIQMLEKMYSLAEPIYAKMREAWPETFQTAAAYEQDTLVLSVNGYTRFMEYMKTSFRDISIPVSMIINYRSSLVLNFSPVHLKLLEKDLFHPSIITNNGQGVPGLLQLTNRGATDVTLSSELSGRARDFDVLASYLFLYNLKFFVYNLDVKLYPDASDDKK